jgi:hypothetical protein
MLDHRALQVNYNSLSQNLQENREPSSDQWDI